MDIKKARILILGVIAAALLSLSLLGFSSVLAQSGYEISWWTMDAGGSESSGGDYSIKGTVGQFDAGSMQGGDISLDGGFWVKGILEDVVEFLVNLPLVIR